MDEPRDSQQESDENMIDMDAMGDFYDDFKTAHETCDSVLIDLELDPTNATLLNSLFRSIHTIKGNLIYVGLKDITPLIQSVEDLLDAIRKNRIEYDSLLCDVVLLTLDKTENMVQSRIDDRPCALSDDEIDRLCINISCIADVAPDVRIEYIKKCLFILDPDTHLYNTYSKEALDALDTRNDIPPVTPKTKLSSDGSREPLVNTDYLVDNKVVADRNIKDVLESHSIEMDEDIYFFESLSPPLENRSFYWKGRTVRLLRLALAMNQKSEGKVDPTQLAVAVLIHDIGMSFLPRSLLTKKGAFTEKERQALHRHPNSGCLLLSESNRWTQAAEMILQHHEQVDGSGYPNHLKGDDICHGAKILAIADTFDARSHERAHRTLLKRPLVRTMNEINNFSGTQFDPYWVDVFNQVVGSPDG